MKVFYLHPQRKLQPIVLICASLMLNAHSAVTHSYCKNQILLSQRTGLTLARAHSIPKEMHGKTDTAAKESKYSTSNNSNWQCCQKDNNYVTYKKVKQDINIYKMTPIRIWHYTNKYVTVDNKRTYIMSAAH